ncbi:hypothetical protein MXB_496 [Myxobolus squamalis]|nr:hypothetical protein MXB_496 [Myxobolus squamalis]
MERHMAKTMFLFTSTHRGLQDSSFSAIIMDSLSNFWSYRSMTVTFGFFEDSSVVLGVVDVSVTPAGAAINDGDGPDMFVCMTPAVKFLPSTVGIGVKCAFVFPVVVLTTGRRVMLVVVALTGITVGIVAFPETVTFDTNSWAITLFLASKNNVTIR